MKYQQIYPWNVETEIKAGNRVFVLFPLTAWTACLNDMSYAEVVGLLANEPDKYYFWKNIEEEE